MQTPGIFKGVSPSNTANQGSPQIWNPGNHIFFNLPLLFSDSLYMDAEVYIEKRILSMTRNGLRQFFDFLDAI
jgi:galactose mutarotase-like enzyme